MQRILAACPAEVRPAYTILAHTGLRAGELIWLTWTDIDPAADILRIRPKDGRRLKAGDTRTVLLTSAVRAVLGDPLVGPRRPRRRNPEFTSLAW